MEHIDTMMGIVFPYINFFIFLGLAIYFFRKPAREAALKRKAGYEKLQSDSRAALDAANAKLDDLRRREANLDREIGEIRAIAKQTGETEAAKILADGERLAQHLKTEAQRIAHAEVEKARAILRKEIVESVRTGVTQKIKSELNNDAQLSLVRTKIGELNNIRAEG